MNGSFLPREFPSISWSQIRLMICIGVGLILFIFLFRRVFNVLIIDICILGDYSSCNCCSSRCNRSQSQEDESGHVSSQQNGQRWSTRDAIILSKLGAFTNPFEYFYNLSVEKRKKLVDAMMEKEILRCCNRDIEQNVQESYDKICKCDIESEGDVSCSICLQPSDDTSCILRSCSHRFHSSCIRSWMERSLSCPVCRTKLISRDELLNIIVTNRSILQ